MTPGAAAPGAPDFLSDVFLISVHMIYCWTIEEICLLYYTMLRGVFVCVRVRVCVRERER